MVVVYVHVNIAVKISKKRDELFHKVNTKDIPDGNGETELQVLVKSYSS